MVVGGMLVDVRYVLNSDSLVRDYRPQLQDYCALLDSHSIWASHQEGGGYQIVIPPN
jgi:hypothetical protein